MSRAPAKTKTSEPARAEDRRRRIIAAATSLFSRYGFRRTSVDLIAAEAGVAKPTIYAYFADKEAVFVAVCADVCEAFLARAEAASRAPGSIEERLAGVLTAKFTYIYELVHRSPHAQELLDSQGALGADLVQKADRAYHRLLTSMLEEGAASGEIAPKQIGLAPGAVASLLMRAGHGAAYDATSTASHARHLTELTRVLVAGLRG
jgi:AcrR family transcriptional regulator